MLVTEFYEGQGLGNQLWLYAVTRCKALELGADFGIQNPEKFKGFNLFDLDLGVQVFGGRGPEGGPPEELPCGITNYFRENLTRHPITGQDITDYSDDWSKIVDNSKIDGNFQGEEYVKPYKQQISNWFKVKNLDMYENPDENLCIINFRGGEYVGIESVFLPAKYWENARRKMLEINPKMKFKVVTDDPKAAERFFPKFEISHQSMEQDYVDILTSQYLIIANTSFAWFPSWLNERIACAIAPKYWWGFNNDSYWACGYAITSGLNYLDKSGRLFTYEECLTEIEKASPAPTLINNRDLIKFETSNARRLLIKNQLNKLTKRIIPHRIKNKLVSSKVAIDRRALAFKTEKIDYFSFLRPRLSHTLENYEGKVYDCFYFFNELNLLEIRMEILNPFVDHFVIFESDRTFTGLKKESIFEANRERFAKFDHKIIHFFQEECPTSRDQVRSILYSKDSSPELKKIAWRSLTSKNVPLDESETHWLIEFFQKESMHLAIKDAHNQDLIFISDVDEIWNPNARCKFQPLEFMAFKQTAYLYKLNLRSNEHWHNWNGSSMSVYEKWKNVSINEVKTHGAVLRRRISKGGWHFTFQNVANSIVEKIEAYSQQELNRKDVKENLEEKIGLHLDIRNRGARLSINDKGLPEFLKQNRNRFKEMFE